MINFLNKYRFSVYVLFISILLSSWSFLPFVSQFRHVPYVVGLSFFLGFVWIYLFNKTCDSVEDQISQPAEAVKTNELLFLRRVLPLLIVIPILLLMWYALPVWPFLIYVVSGFLYSYPVYKSYRIKNVTVLKNVAAAFYALFPVWVGVNIYFLEMYRIPVYVDYLAFVVLFIMFMIGELIWDIRDVAGDTVSNVKTIPVVFGVTAAKVYCLVLLAVAFFFISPSVGNMLIMLLNVSFVLSVTPETNRYQFHAFLYAVSALLIMDVWIHSH